MLGIYEASSRGVSGTVADPKLIFMTALKMNACNLIISHNHPSGNTEPSEADKISLVELRIALQEKDNARRTYINSLRQFWECWYLIQARSNIKLQLKNE